ncbi:MAG: nucleotidyltransferase family protein [Firmicutes bacterium]|nr:nucleotidyltransferase family protein [Bacillota bacterium]
MTTEFLQFLYMYGCGARGISPKPCEEFDLNKIIEISGRHNAFDFVFLAINKLRESGELWGISDDAFAALNKRFLASYSSNYARRASVLKVLGQLEKSQVPYRVIKGIVLSELYSEPVVRVSCDTDVLVNPEDEKDLISRFKTMGFEFEVEKEESHHSVCRHPLAGMFEIHHRLYDEIFDDSWFENKFGLTEKPIKILAGDTMLTTVGITDGFIFNLLHLIKHFLLTGTSAQQIMDVLLYAKKYNDEIDWKRTFDILNQLKYYKFFGGVLTIGTEYFGFSASDFPHFVIDKNAADNILSDLEEGGAYGALERSERDKFYHAYTAERLKKEHKNVSYEKYVAEKKHISLVTKLFSRPSVLYARYPFVGRHHWLLPIGWIMRWCGGIRLFAQKKLTIGEYISIMPDKHNEVINQRMDKVRELDMF